MTYQQLLGKYVLCGQIECVTGLHIGGTTTGIEIGGVDNPVIKDPVTDRPYIPGSSLKGKLRSLTEWSFGLIEKNPNQQDSYAAYDCHELENGENSQKEPNSRYDYARRLAQLFGPASDKKEVRLKAGPTRLTVRDSFLTPESKVALEYALGRGSFTEVKTENFLDRVTSEATPRPLERVPAGSVFGFTLILDAYLKEDRDLLRDLFAAMRLLEQSALGGSGARGSGQIGFKGLTLAWRDLDYYRTGAAEQAIVLPGAELEAIIQHYADIQWKP